MKLKNETDLRLLCRICLNIKADSLDLFSQDAKTILENISLCFQVRLVNEHSLPKLICIDCMNELNAANSFRLKCLAFTEEFAKINRNEIFYDNVSTPLLASNNEFEHDQQNLFTAHEKSEDHTNVDSQDYYECDICGKTLKSKKSLQKHITSMHQMRKHIGKVTGYGSGRQYHCTICTYCTPHSQTLVNHMRKHDGKRPYICQCGKNFTQSSSLNAHIKTHDDTKYFICTICGKQFKHSFTLKRHLSVHDGGKFCCNLCDKVLKSKRSLQDHKQRHYNIRNYNCEDCGDTFITSSELHHHKNKHNMNYKHQCNLCEYKTQEKKSLILHLKRHTGNKPYKCGFCEVTFYTQGEARRHQRVHTKEKPFICPTCSQRFAYSPSLNKHMLMVHSVQYKWGDVKNENLKKVAYQLKVET